MLQLLLHVLFLLNQVLAKLPCGTLGQAELICENIGSPQWLMNAIREHQCLVKYLESQVRFKSFNSVDKYLS